jgi:hypothetical protein
LKTILNDLSAMDVRGKKLNRNLHIEKNQSNLFYL